MHAKYTNKLSWKKVHLRQIEIRFCKLFGIIVNCVPFEKEKITHMETSSVLGLWSLFTAFTQTGIFVVTYLLQNWTWFTRFHPNDCSFIFFSYDRPKTKDLFLLIFPWHAPNQVWVFANDCVNYLKVIVPTVELHLFCLVSQYRKYPQTNIRIHFVNNKLTNFYVKMRFIRIRAGINWIFSHPAQNFNETLFH